MFGALPQSIKGAETRTYCTTAQQPKLCAEEVDLHHREKTEMKLTFSVILATCALMAVNGVSGDEIESGQRVGISISYFNQWLGCAGQWCARATCRQVFFSRPTTQCWGEVFYIYSEEAHGLPIKVGDNVMLLSTIQERVNVSNARRITVASTHVQGPPHLKVECPVLRNGINAVAKYSLFMLLVEPLVK